MRRAIICALCALLAVAAAGDVPVMPPPPDKVHKGGEYTSRYDVALYIRRLLTPITVMEARMKAVV